MREIKFRGIAIYGERFIYGNLKVFTKSKSSGGTKYFILSNNSDDLNYGGMEVRKETVGQYTGIKDKNGKEIYDGDIINYNDNDKMITDSFIEPVEWIKNRFNCGFGTDSSCSVWVEVAIASEIIGNIYENPELLK